MQSVSSRIWTRVAVSISYDDNHYTTDNDHNDKNKKNLLFNGFSHSFGPQSENKRKRKEKKYFNLAR